MPTTQPFDHLYADYQPRLRSYCRRMLGDEPSADDVAQETLYRLWLHRDEISDAKANCWLMRVAYNLCIDVIRARGRVVPAATVPDRPADGPDPANGLEREEARRRVNAAMRVINARHREVLDLHDVRGVAYRDIADLLGVTEVGARAVVWRARRALAAAVN